MKKIIFAAAIILGCFAIKAAKAQVHLNVGVNIGNQPEWGPTGYDHVDYYYMPDIDSYYDINAHQYVYLNNNAWVHSASLPPRYANYDVYHGYKVVVKNSTSWMHNDTYRRKYASYKGRNDQVIIRDSHDEKYKNHWQGDRGRGRGHDDHRRH